MTETPHRPQRGEIYIERRRLGQYLRIAAIDAETGLEVFVSGPAKASPADLEALAVRKLKRNLQEQQAARNPPSKDRFA